MENATKTSDPLVIVEQNENKITKHKKLYYIFLALTIIGILNTGMAGVINGGGNGMGLLGSMVYSITGIAFFATVVEIVVNFWFFWLIFALLERRHLKKLGWNKKLPIA